MNATTPLHTALKTVRGSLIMTGLFSLVINLLLLAGPLYMMQIYDRVLISRSYDTLIVLSGLVAGLFLFMGGLEFVRSRVLVRIGVRIENAVGEPLLGAVVRRRLANRGSGDGEQSLSDLRSIRDVLSGPGPIALFDVPWVPIYLAILFVLHAYLGYVAVFGALLLFGTAALNDRVSRRPLTDAAESYKSGTQIALASERNAEAISAMGMMRGLSDRWRQFQNAGLTRQADASDRAGGFAAASKTLRIMLQSAMLGVGAALVIDDQISAGAMIAASIILGRALAPVEQTIGHWRSFLAVKSSADRIVRLLRDHAEPSDRLSLPPAEAKLQVNRLFAGPPGAVRPVLSGLDFTLDAGDVLAVLGPSAAGKSTLARLLGGVWPAQAGSIRLDGAAIEQWDPMELGRQVGYLPQDVELFAGTVAENIARFQSDPEPEAIVAAARTAGAHDMILQLPEGYNTEIGDDGGRLSGGQRQRLGLARAIYDAPFLVILDEPNANLDAEGDQALTSAIQELSYDGCIVVVIAHRPSAIEAANKILVLQNGRQSAFGSKDDVLSTPRLAPAAAANVTSLPARVAS